MVVAFFVELVDTVAAVAAVGVDGGHFVGGVVVAVDVETAAVAVGAAFYVQILRVVASV